MDRGIILVIAAAIISGVSVFLNAFGVKGLDPFAFTGAKNLLVAILLFSMIAFTTRITELRSLSKRQWSYLIIIGLIGGSIPFLLFFKGLSMIDAASGSFVHKTMVVWVTIGAVSLLNEKIDWRIVAGAAALLLGNFLFLQITGLKLSAGLFYVFIATLLWSVELLLSKKVLAEISARALTFGRMGFGALFILVFIALTGHIGAVMTWNSESWSWVAITSVFLLGYVWTFYTGLSSVKVSTAVAILSTGSVITTLLQALFQDMVLSTGQIFGSLLIIIGAVAFVLPQKEVCMARSSAYD